MFLTRLKAAASAVKSAEPRMPLQRFEAAAQVERRQRVERCADRHHRVDLVGGEAALLEQEAQALDQERGQLAAPFAVAAQRREAGPLLLRTRAHGVGGEAGLDFLDQRRQRDADVEPGELGQIDQHAQQALRLPAHRQRIARARSAARRRRTG